MASQRRSVPRSPPTTRWGSVRPASERGCHDALHRHFLDLAYERLRDPEYRAILEEFLEKTHRFLARRKGK